MFGRKLDRSWLSPSDTAEGHFMVYQSKITYFSCLRWFIEVKNSQMFIQSKTSPRLEIIAGWGPLPISMALRSERSLKSKMLSLARTSKYVNNTSVLSINKSDEDS